MEQVSVSMIGFQMSQTFRQYVGTHVKHTENFKLKHNLDKKQIIEGLTDVSVPVSLLQMFILLMKKKQCLILTYQNICYTLE